MKINPKNFFNRRLNNIPPHFITTSTRLTDYEEIGINQWIHENCSGRYCLVKNVKWKDDAWRTVYTIGFEEPSDLTLFALSGKLNTEKSNF